MGSRRPFYSEEFKQKLVDESVRSEKCASYTAKKHKVPQSTLSRWRIERGIKCVKGREFPLKQHKRGYSESERNMMMEECRTEDILVVAHKHGVHPATIYKWIRIYNPYRSPKELESVQTPEPSKTLIDEPPVMPSTVVVSGVVPSASVDEEKEENNEIYGKTEEIKQYIRDLEKALSMKTIENTHLLEHLHLLTRKSK